MSDYTQDPISDMPTVALVQRSPRVGLSAAVALFIVTIETVAATVGCFGFLYVGWRDEGVIASSLAPTAALLACVGLITLRTMRVLQRLMASGEIMGRLDLLAMVVCAMMHAGLAGALTWLTIVDPVDAKSNVVVIGVAFSAIATAVVLGLSGRAGRLPSDDEVSADARALKARVDEARSDLAATSAPGERITVTAARS